MTTETLTAAAAFFAEHAGASYNPSSETLEEGRIRNAYDLADAEAFAHRNGYTFEWEDDWSVGSHRAYFGPDSAYSDGEPETCETCVLLDPDGQVIDTLGCIDGATAEYRQVVQAGMATEILQPWQVGAGRRVDEMGKQVDAWAVCGHCGRTWNDALSTSRTPAPSARCPFEELHEYPAPADELDTDPSTTLARIHAAMTGRYWSADTLDEIAGALIAAGFTIEAPTEEEN